MASGRLADAGTSARSHVAADEWDPDNPRALDVCEQMRDGRPITLRAVRPDDKARLLEAFRNLEPSSIYTRFFAYKKTLSEEELTRATEIDYETVVALVATIPSDGDEMIIGHGAYAVDVSRDPPERAEVAFVVEEDFQGQGIASLLLRYLTRIARAEALKEFNADVLPGNPGMVAVFRGSGLPMKETWEDGGVHVTMSLD